MCRAILEALKKTGSNKKTFASWCGGDDVLLGSGGNRVDRSSVEGGKRFFASMDS